MKLRVSHSTSYEYTALVTNSVNEARLSPLSDETQVCLEHHLVIDPSTRTFKYHDFFGNLVQFFEIQKPHQTLTVESHAIVETLLENPFNFSKRIPISTFQENLYREELYDYLVDSTHVPLSPPLRKLAEELISAYTDVWPFLVDATKYVYKTFRYMPGATHVQTTATEALEKRAGVCQDYAHVLIGLCRCLKIPARYVSGYLYETNEMPMIGDGLGDAATHAWCEVYLPGVGWRGLDPTNGLIANDHYVKVALGRDYSDAAPLRGIYRGPNVKSLKVNVLVERISENIKNIEPLRPHVSV